VGGLVDVEEAEDVGVLDELHDDNLALNAQQHLPHAAVS
jgi:hypothetical protein